MAELLDGKHFPLRFVGYGPDGKKETGRVEVTKVDKKTLPATDFTYPPTYAVIDIEQMFRGLGAHGNGSAACPAACPVACPAGCRAASRCRRITSDPTAAQRPFRPRVASCGQAVLW